MRRLFFVLAIFDFPERGERSAFCQKRNAVEFAQLPALCDEKEELEKKMSEQCHIQNTEEDIVPTTQHILDNYDGFTPAEKNELWKKVMEKITVYRAPNGETSLHIYPKLQKKN